MVGLPRRASAADCSNSPLPIISSRRPWEGSSPAPGAHCFAWPRRGRRLRLPHRPPGVGTSPRVPVCSGSGMAGHTGSMSWTAASNMRVGTIARYRLTRSLMDFARIIETFDARDVCFVSVTQQFNSAPRRRVSLVEEGTTQTVVGLIW